MLFQSMEVPHRKDRKCGMKVLVLSPEWAPGRAKECFERIVEYFEWKYTDAVREGALTIRRHPFPNIQVHLEGVHFPSEMTFRDYEQHFGPNRPFKRKHFDVIWLFDN